MRYAETLWSELYSGNTTTSTCLQPAALAIERSFDLDDPHRRRTVYRLDGGAGTDENLAWLLARSYQVVAKGFSGRRAHALAQQVDRWDPAGRDAFVGSVMPPMTFSQPIQIVVKKWLKNDHWQHSYYVTTLKLPSKQAFLDYYDLRGAAEIVQFREDKSGLFLSMRRKRRWNAQKSLLHLTDLAHNLLADFRFRALCASPFESWGLKRIVRDLLAMPGRIYFDGPQVKRIEFQARHPYARELLHCLQRYQKQPFEQ